MGKWTVVALPDVAGSDPIVLDSLADSLEPSIGGDKNKEIYVAWTEVRQELPVLRGKYQVVIVNLKDPKERFTIPNARHPSFAKNEWSGAVEFVFELYSRTGDTAIGFVDLNNGISNPKLGIIPVKCDHPRRPVATFTDGLTVLYTCNPKDDPASTELRIVHRESRCVGPRPDDYDIFVGEPGNYCP